MRAGIVGLPNVGKSTLFNCLSDNKAQSENFPFCTIDPNISIINVPDSRLYHLRKIVEPEKIIPTTVKIVDIAGLVKGASKGEGLGNKFLSNIRETDAILHVLRCFDDPNIVHVDGRIDPVNDKEIVQYELQLKDLEIVNKRLEKLTKTLRSGNDDSKKDHLSESAEKNAVLLIGDTDLLVNETSVRVQRTIFGNQVQMINGNLAFVQNAVEIMGGDSNLITVRSREDQNRPFEKINEMQEEATKKFNAELKRAQEKLESIVAEKSKMEQNNNQGENQVLTIKINQEDLKQIRKQEAEAQRQIRQVRKDLRKDIDRLQLRLQLANVGVIPLLIIISGIVFFLIKRRKTAAV